METYILEINLISAQGLKLPSTNLRRMQTYALAWVDSAVKLRTRIDRIGGENPTWNDKFFFRVTGDFISNENSAVSIEIYSVGYLKDLLIGTVRFLIGNCLSVGFCSPAPCVNFGIPSFSALQIRRPSGRFHGVLNIGSMVINGSDFPVLTGISAIGYRDLMGENSRKHQKSRRKTIKREEFTDENSCGNSSCGDTGDYSDADSSCSSTTTTTTTSTVLKDWNGRRDITMMSKDRSDGSGLLCGLGFQRKDSSDSIRSEIAD
ncbi:Calcium-dependent lipid-binding (CaLB domain) family protein [Thalictrum thalictroides]|uniref:Calcium-dependent lipid-binding (CaLB domain) family protein n=1 Tax=Thalictrum thalictroides TaxID=46969 RepID=A0A7J6WFA4_THATH|nr:Calcium-dependent lipid-binding (CaLB domain) family protein [Thalictrum thalictroides]